MKNFLKIILLKITIINLWLFIAFLIRWYSTPVEQRLIANMGLSFIELNIGGIPISFMWVTLFIFFKHILVRQEKINLYTIFYIALFLNMLEYLVAFGGGYQILIAAKENGLFDSKTWRNMPELPEISSLIFVSILYAYIFTNHIDNSRHR